MICATFSFPYLSITYWITSSLPSIQKSTSTSGILLFLPGFKNLSKINILVVDDEDYMREIVRQALEGSGFAIDEAATGAMAIEKMRRYPYDVIVTDLRLPEIRVPLVQIPHYDPFEPSTPPCSVPQQDDYRPDKPLRLSALLANQEPSTTVI
jgi:hypothetical protein